MKLKNKQLAIEGIKECMENTKVTMNGIIDQPMTVLMANQIAILLVILGILEGDDL